MSPNLKLTLSAVALALILGFGCEQKKAKQSDDVSAAESLPTSTEVSTYTEDSVTTDCYVSSIDTSTSTSTSTETATSTTSSSDCGSTGTSTNTDEDEFFNPQAKVDCENAGKPYIFIKNHEGCFENLTLVKAGSDWCTDKNAIINKFRSYGYSSTSLQNAWTQATQGGAIVDQCGIVKTTMSSNSGQSVPAGNPVVLFVLKTKTTDANGDQVPTITQWAMPDVLPR